MSNTINLLKFDALALGKHLDLTNDDTCFYWREYTPDTKFDHSPTNQLIHNFKISAQEINPARMTYKRKAVAQIAEELTEVIKKEEAYRNFTFVPMPPSKTSTHLEYDTRLIQVLERASELKRIPMDVRLVVSQHEDAESAHVLDKRLSIEALCKLYVVNEALIWPIPKKVIIFDDVLTKGTHFKAMQMVLKRIWPGVPIIGIFVARSVYKLESVAES